MARRVDSLTAWEKKHPNLTTADWKQAAIHLADEADAMDDWARVMAKAIADSKNAAAAWERRYKHTRALWHATRAMLRDANVRVEHLTILLTGSRAKSKIRLSYDDVFALADARLEIASEVGYLEASVEDRIVN